MPGSNRPPGQPDPGGGGGATRPPATTTFTPPALPFARPGVSVFVRRSDGTLLPNVVALRQQKREFEPPVASFRYRFGFPNSNPKIDPFRVEHVFPLTAKGARVVEVDDRLQIIRMLPGKPPKAEILFDGFMVAPQAELGGDTEGVAFTAIGAPIRERDIPLGGAVMRDIDGSTLPPHDGTNPEDTQDIATELPTRFNPSDGGGFIPNATADGGDSEVPDVVRNGVAVGLQDYPVFIDETQATTAGGRAWTLPMAVKYCMCLGNPEQEFTLLGDVKRLDPLLRAVKPAPGTSTIDMANPDTFVYEDISVPDIDVKGSTWPDAVRRLIEPHGFAFRWDLTTRADGKPEWRIIFYRKDDVANGKPAYLQKAPADLIPGKSTVSNLSMVRDTAGAQNEWYIGTKPKLYEASLILAPSFVPNPDDNTSLDPEVTKRFVKGQDITGSIFVPDLYRVLVFGEGGEGWWDKETGTYVRDIPSLRSVFQPGTGEGDPRLWVHRNRKPVAKLASLDILGKPRRAELWMSNNYQTGTQVWDPDYEPTFGTKGGDWVRITRNGWKLLDDELGIEFTMTDPRVCPTGQDNRGIGPEPSSTSLNLVAAFNSARAVADPVASQKGGWPYFRLTCAFEGDLGIGVKARKRSSAPSKYIIRRWDDSEDRFRLHVVSARSHIAAEADVTIDTNTEDDTKAAQAHADSRRRANECGTFSGSLTIPYLTWGYTLGDKFTKLVGRDIDFAMNAGRESGESSINPCIVGLDETFDPHQSVVVTYQDFRAEPAPEHRRHARE